MRRPATMIGCGGAIRLATVSIVAALVCGCAARQRMPTPPEAATAGSPGTDALRIVLLWGEAVDLDLYVTDPALETVYFANTPSASGGRLERDASCRDTQAARSETIRWRDPPPGRYRVGVDFMDRCGRNTREVPYRVVVDVRGKRLEQEGTVRLARFVYEAIAFDVPAEMRPR